MSVYKLLLPILNKLCSTNLSTWVILIKCTTIDPKNFSKSFLLSHLILAIVQLFSFFIAFFADFEICPVIKSRTVVAFTLFILIEYITTF